MYKRILTVQDISCVGQCSMTVALPILSACGHETCILPAAVLSTHTGGFGKPVIRNLADMLPEICRHWRSQQLCFDGIYTGYLGSVQQIVQVQEIFDALLAPGGVKIVDPAMADHGKLYSGLDEDYASAMKELCRAADVVIPNVTEICMMTGMAYREDLDAVYVEELLTEMGKLGMHRVVLTGVGFSPDETGVMVYDHGTFQHYSHKRIPKSYHGTGDIFAAAFVGAWMRGNTLEKAAQIGADYTCCCIQKTWEAPAHWYGVRFEPVLPMLMEKLEDR